MVKVPVFRGRAPVALYRGALRDYDLLAAAGKTAEAHRALHLCSAAVNNLQIVNYLLSKNSPFFSEAAEKDMVDDLIEENWDEFLRENGGRLVFLSPSEKIELFGNSLIVFPG